LASGRDLAAAGPADSDVLMKIPAWLVLEPEDALYICGTDRYYEEFPT
jgi:hypothetical protein